MKTSTIILIAIGLGVIYIVYKNLSLIKHALSGLSSTIPGYHPEYQSEAFEELTGKIESGEEAYQPFNTDINKIAVSGWTQEITDPDKKQAILKAYNERR